MFVYLLNQTHDQNLRMWTPPWACQLRTPSAKDWLSLVLFVAANNFVMNLSQVLSHHSLWRYQAPSYYYLLSAGYYIFHPILRSRYQALWRIRSLFEFHPHSKSFYLRGQISQAAKLFFGDHLRFGVQRSLFPFSWVFSHNTPRASDETFKGGWPLRECGD